VFETKCKGEYFDLGEVKGGGRNPHYEELCNLISSPDIMRKIKSN
jgi:hypothetical protein